MRWTVFIIITLLMLALETSLRVVLRLESIGRISPSFLASLLVFLGLFAPRQHALWGALVLGVLLDLCTPLQQPAGGDLYIIGPYALGYVVACFMVLQVRAMVFRRRLLSFCVLTLLALTLASIISVTIYMARSWLPWTDGLYPTQPSAMSELARGLGIALYSALLAVPLGWLLIHSARLWRFAQLAPSRGTA